MSGILKKLTPEQIEDSVYLHSIGFTIREIAICFDVSAPAICRMLQKYEPEPRPKRVAKDTRSIVASAIARGVLVPNNTCEACGKVQEPTHKIIGHHDDYNKPIVVRWLCQSCHRQWHAINTAKGLLRSGIPTKPVARKIANDLLRRIS
jgi:hypothetical protein